MVRALKAVKRIVLSVVQPRKPNVPVFPKAVFYTLVSIVLLGPLAFQSTSTALSVLWDGYNLARDAVSILVFGPYGWLQTAGFYVFGISLLALSLIWFAKVRVTINGGAILLVLLGAGFIMIGAYTGPPPGEVPDYSGLIHGVAVSIVVAVFPLTCFLLAPVLKAWGYRGLYIYTVVIAVFATLFIAIGGPVLGLHYSLIGIFERVLLWNGQLWLLVLCIRLIVAEVKQRRVLGLQPAYAAVHHDA